MVSYIYTKTSSIFLIKNPPKILLNIKEMESLSSNIDSRTVCFLPSALGFWIIPRFLFVINHKMLKFFGIYFIPQVKTHIIFSFVFREVIFQILRKIPWDTQNSIIISKQTADIYTAFFMQLFQCKIYTYSGRTSSNFFMKEQ